MARCRWCPTTRDSVKSGATGAVFFTPDSVPELAGHVWQLASDDAHLAGLEAVIRDRLRLRSWAAVAAQVLRDASAGPAGGPAGGPDGGPAGGLPEPRARLVPPLGQPHPLGLLPGPEPGPAMALADLLRDGGGWVGAAAWGATARLGDSRLCLRLPAEAEGAALRVYLELLGTEATCRVTLRAWREGGAAPVSQRLELREGERAFAMLALPAGPGAALVVALDASPGAPAAATTVGACSLMACRADDHLARLDYLEARALARLPGSVPRPRHGPSRRAGTAAATLKQIAARRSRLEASICFAKKGVKQIAERRSRLEA